MKHASVAIFSFVFMGNTDTILHAKHLLELKAVSFLIFVGLAVIDANAATLTVTSSNDSGPGSLRDAIIAANQTAGPDTIVFSLPTGQRCRSGGARL